MLFRYCFINKRRNNINYNHITLQYSICFLHESTYHPIENNITFASSSGVKSDTILKVLRISSGDLPFIMLATFAQLEIIPTQRFYETSSKGWMIRKFAATIKSINSSVGMLMKLASHSDTISRILLLFNGRSMSAIGLSIWYVPKDDGWSRNTNRIQSPLIIPILE